MCAVRLRAVAGVKKLHSDRASTYHIHFSLSQLLSDYGDCKHTRQLRSPIQHREIAAHCVYLLLNVINECRISGVLARAAIQLGPKHPSTAVLAGVVNGDGVRLDSCVWTRLVRHDGELDCPQVAADKSIEDAFLLSSRSMSTDHNTRQA